MQVRLSSTACATFSLFMAKTPSWYSFLLNQDVTSKFFSRQMLQISRGRHINKTYFPLFPLLFSLVISSFERNFWTNLQWTPCIRVLKSKVLHRIWSAGEVLYQSHLNHKKNKQEGYKPWFLYLLPSGEGLVTVVCSWENPFWIKWYTYSLCGEEGYDSCDFISTI